MLIKTTEAEIDMMIREARRESAITGWQTRRERRQLRNLYALEDGRETASGARYYPDDSVSFFERLYGLEDSRSVGS